MRRASLFIAPLAALFFVTTPPSNANDHGPGEWVSLFNGTDLTGWTAAKPRSRAENQKKNTWKVDAGTLTNGAKGQNDLCTTAEFDNYELEIEYKINERGNSGVYLRGQIEIQIFDSWKKKDEELKSVDAGAIYGGNFVALKNAQKPVGEWNQYRVLHVGHRITVWHNGVLIQDNVYADSKTGGAMTETPGGRKLETDRGPLMLQGDHEHVWYRNIRVRPVCSPGAGWRAIWNGADDNADLSAFTAKGNDQRLAEGWKVADRAFYNAKWGGEKGGHGFDIWTKENFGNFIAYYAYKSNSKTEGGNSGFYLRDQWEIQIFKDSSLTDKHRDGALYSIYPPVALARHGEEQWNHVFVKLNNMKIWVWQNGKLIHDGRICPRRTDSGKPTTAFHRAPFKIQGDHGQVHFSNIWIKELPDTKHAD